jgi:hypothetical protein
MKCADIERGVLVAVQGIIESNLEATSVKHWSFHSAIEGECRKLIF